MVTTTEVRQRAAELIEERGWTKGTATSGLCATLALEEASREVPFLKRDDVVHRALEEMRVELGISAIFTWNDRPERTLDEVLAALRGGSS